MRLIKRIRPIRLIRPRNLLFDIVGAVLLAGILIGIFAYFTSKPVSAAWFDDNWNYRTRVDITNPSGSTQTDYQTLITINTQTFAFLLGRTDNL